MTLVADWCSASGWQNERVFSLWVRLLVSVCEQR